MWRGVNLNFPQATDPSTTPLIEAGAYQQAPWKRNGQQVFTLSGRRNRQFFTSPITNISP